MVTNSAIMSYQLIFLFIYSEAYSLIGMIFFIEKHIFTALLGPYCVSNHFDDQWEIRRLVSSYLLAKFDKLHLVLTSQHLPNFVILPRPLRHRDNRWEILQTSRQAYMSP